jgi:hypothetical protein
MSCCGCGGFNPTSCAQCCSQWTLPGGATAVPTEIQAAVSISAFEVCFVAGRNFGFSAPVCAKLGTISLGGTYTLTRQGIGGGCGSWSYDNCSGNERVTISAGLVFAGGACIWSAGVTYRKWLPCAEDQFASGGIYRHPDMLSCNGTDYGYTAGARGSSFSTGTLPEFTMTFPCQAGSFSGSVPQQTGAPIAWGSYCGRPGIICSTGTACGCDSIGWPGDCPNNPTSTVTITLTV